MRILRTAAVLVDLVVLAIAAAMVATRLSVPPFELFWEDVSLGFLVLATAVTVVCLRPWTLARPVLYPPFVPRVARAVNVAFAVTMALTFFRAEGSQPLDLLVRFLPALLLRLVPFAVLVALNLFALRSEPPPGVARKAPALLRLAAVVVTAAWAAFFAFPLTFAGVLFGVRPAG